MQLHSSIVLISTALTQEVEGVKRGGVTGHKVVYNRGVLNRFFKSLNVMREGRHKSHHFLVRPLNDVKTDHYFFLPHLFFFRDLLLCFQYGLNLFIMHFVPLQDLLKIT